MGPEQRSDGFSHEAFAAAFLPPEYQCGAKLDFGLLHELGEPADDPIVELLTPLAHIVPDVIQELGTVPWAWHDGETSPQIVMAGYLAVGREHQAFILAPVRMGHPRPGDRDPLAFVVLN